MQKKKERRETKRPRRDERMFTVRDGGGFCFALIHSAPVCVSPERGLVSVIQQMLAPENNSQAAHSALAGTKRRTTTGKSLSQMSVRL